jgi:hypothetical protein
MGKYRFSTLLLAVFTALSVLATPVAAQQQPPPPPAGMAPIDELLDGRSIDPRTTAPVAGLPLYQDTGIGQPADWKFTVPQGKVAIVGGVKVVDHSMKDDHDKGFMRAYPEGYNVDVTVVDGWYVIKPARMANGEMCVRAWQHLQLNGWLMSDIQGLQGMNPCWRQYVQH